MPRAQKQCFIALLLAALGNQAGAQDTTVAIGPALNYKGSEPGMTSQQIRRLLGVKKDEAAHCEKPVKEEGYSPWPVCRMHVKLDGDDEWWSELVLWVDPKGSIARTIIVTRYPAESIPDTVIWALIEADWGPPDSVRHLDSGREMDRWWSKGDRFATADYYKASGHPGKASITYRIWEEPGYRAQLSRRADSLSWAKRNAVVADSIRRRKATIADSVLLRTLSPSKHE